MMKEGVALKLKVGERKVPSLNSNVCVVKPPVFLVYILIGDVFSPNV